MSNRDTGIRALIPGQRSPDEIKEDRNTKRYVETVLNRSPQVHPREENLGETLVRATPSLNLTRTSGVETKETKDFRSQKEYENHLINSPTKQQHEKAFNMGNQILKVSEATKNKMADQWMRSGGRDPNGRSLDQEIKISKNILHEKQKDEAAILPVGLGNKYKSDIRTPVQKKRDSYNAKVDANKAKADPTKGAHYSPWYERLAAEKKEKEEEDPRTEGRMEALQKIEDEGKSWFSKHLKNSQ